MTFCVGFDLIQKGENMTSEQVEAIKSVVNNVASNEINKKRDKTPQETQLFIANRDNFLAWLGSKLTREKAREFFQRIGVSSGAVPSMYIFCYAIENPDAFAWALIETLEEG